MATLLSKIDDLIHFIEKTNDDHDDREEKSSESPLFTKLQFGKVTLSNRIALAPMTRSRATEKFVPTDMMATYYTKRSDGLLITEGCGISAQGLGWYRAPGIWNEEQIEEWTKIVALVHKVSGVIGCQLWHLGRQAHSAVTGQQIVSASAIALSGEARTVRGARKPYETPKELSKDEIKSVVNDYVNAAANALNKAGFDFVEIHAANGYLIDQFLQSVSNKRKDAYGGSLEKRMLFMKEIVNAMIAKGIDNKCIGIRLSPNGKFGQMGAKDNIETFNAAIEWLAHQDLLYIHVLDGISWPSGGFHEKCEVFTLKKARAAMKKAKGSTVLIGNVGYTKKTAEEAIANGDADLIAFGRQYIANPDLVYRFKNDIELEKEAPYQYWWAWNSTEKGYSDWQTAKK